MRKKKGKSEELTSLTVQPHTDFTIEELELRLETDPLFVGNMFNFSDNSVAQSNKGGCVAETCEHTCSCYGIFIDTGNCPDYNCTPVYCSCVGDTPCVDCPGNNPPHCPGDFGGSSGCPTDNFPPVCPRDGLLCPPKLGM